MRFPTTAILAGGLGTRLYQAVPNLAKSIVSVAGQPFLIHLLKQLARAGSRRIVLCTGYRAEQIYREIGDGFEGTEMLYSIEDQPMGTGGALRLAWQRYGGNDADGWLVTNGDSFFDLDPHEFWCEHRRGGLPITLAAVECADGSRYGRLVLDGADRVVRFEEKEPDSGTCWINAGIYGLAPEFLGALSASMPLSLEREVFPDWISRGIHVFARRARFIDIGTPESYRIAQQFFAEETR